MGVCEKCKMAIVGTQGYCPLCQSKLNFADDAVEEQFPQINNSEDRYAILFKVVTFLSVVASVLAIVFNLTLDIEGWWSLIVIAGAGSIWLSMVVALYNYKNLLRSLIYEGLIIFLFMAFLDYRLGWQGWSIAYVLPTLCTANMIIMYTLSKVLKLDTGDYMIYLLLDALFGIIPILFLNVGSLAVRLPSIVCIIVSVISVTGLIIFEGRNMYAELKRRLHV